MDKTVLRQSPGCAAAGFRASARRGGAFPSPRRWETDSPPLGDGIACLDGSATVSIPILASGGVLQGSGCRGEALGCRVEGLGFRFEAPAPRGERLVFYCRTTSASTAPCTSRRMCCPMHCASYCVPCQQLLPAFSGWIRSPPPT